MDAMAAAAASGTRASGSASGECTPRSSTAPEPEIVEEVAGLTALTMTAAVKGGRPVSFLNADLPALFYADGVGRLTKSSSEDQLNRATSSPPVPEDGKVLDYWRMERELREARDELRKKREEVDEMQQQTKAMEMEMADLQCSLFEKAHEMVRVEKEARHKDNCLLREAEAKSEILTEEVKALKALVADHVVRGDSRSPEAGAASPPTSPVEVEKGNVDSILFNEFMKWHLNPSLDDNADYMKRVLSEDITPCLRFHPNTMKISSAILKTIVDNALVIEAIPAGTEAATTCRLSKAKRACTYRVKVRKKKVEGEPVNFEWIHVCTPTRDRIIAVANFYTYARYIVQGLVKAKITDVYWKLVELRLQVNRARLGMTIQ